MTTVVPEPLEPHRLHEGVSHWLGRPGVVGLTMARKYVDGRQTPRLAIQVQVLRKRPPHELGPGDLSIPPTVDLAVRHPDGTASVERIPTDVVESTGIMPAALERKARPCPGGYRAGGYRPGTRFDDWYSNGTLGGMINWGGAKTVLTAGHVLTGCDTGTDFYQPLPDIIWNDLFRRWEDLKVGIIEGTVPVVSYLPDEIPKPPKLPTYNHHDLGWVRPKGDTCSYRIGAERAELWQPEKDSIGLAHRLAPWHGVEVEWVGASTGPTIQKGTLDSVYGRHTMQWGMGKKRVAFFENLIFVEVVTGEKNGENIYGDSGALATYRGFGRQWAFGVLAGWDVINGKTTVVFTAIPDKKPEAPPFGTRCA
ncbi:MULTISPECIES: hypothetical protein [unclassified Streptomyces]|uniref:hypothetical protein n=1 Tax=unclassified Streptomyces TaxID=2593676 RepID=UPI002E3188D9|nr:hypothetical protein [Streptomyces sp. NBC_01268]